MKKIFRKIKCKVAKLSRKKFYLSCILSGLFITATYLFLHVVFPESTNVQSPVIVAYCDCDSLPNARIEILDKETLKVMVNFNKCNFDKWNSIMVQYPESAKNVDVEIDGDKLSNHEINLDSQLKDGLYFKFNKEKFKKYFNSRSKSLVLSYEMKEGIYKKNFNRYFLSVLFIPTNGVRQNYPVPIEIQSPQSFLLTSSIPSAYRIFLLQEGINYTFSTINERSGLLLIFDDLSAEANKEVILLISTTILGFVLGFVLEKIIFTKQSTTDNSG